MNESNCKVEIEDNTKLLYDYNHPPKWYKALIYGFQFFLIICIPNSVATLLICKELCMKDSDSIKSELISISFFVMGINTLMQSIFGARLTILQGATYTIIIPILSYVKQNGGDQCDRVAINLVPSNQTERLRDPSVLKTILEINGALMISSGVEILLAVTGCVGLLMKLISPLSLSAIFFVLCIAVFKTIVLMMGTNWIISILSVVIMIVLILFLSDVNIPFWLYEKKAGCFKTKTKIFETCPIIIATFIMCIICGILTVIPGVLSTNSTHWTYPIRMDTRSELFTESKPAILPYPFRYGYPKISGQLLTSAMFCVMISAVESIGDYMITSKIIGAPQPPKFAINRGIFCEGIGVFLSGFLGIIVAPTSYSNNVGLIRVTKVGHLVIAQIAAVIMVICGFFPIISSVIASIPDAIIGGTNFIIICLIMGESLSFLRMVNFSLKRNVLVFTISVAFGIFIPYWVQNNKEKIKTGKQTADDIIISLLDVGMFITAICSIILDLIFPGERIKLSTFFKTSQTSLDCSESAIKEAYRYYDLAPLRWLAIKIPCLQRLPMFPSFYSKKFKESSMPNNDHYLSTSM